MISKLKTLSLATLAATLMTSPALATTKNDLIQCKAAINAGGDYSTEEYSVKFRSTKGNSRNKTVKLQLKNKANNEKYSVNCKLRKGEVIDLQIAPK